MIEGFFPFSILNFPVPIIQLCGAITQVHNKMALLPFA